MDIADKRTAARSLLRELFEEPDSVGSYYLLSQLEEAVYSHDSAAIDAFLDRDVFALLDSVVRHMDAMQITSL